MVQTESAPEGRGVILSPLERDRALGHKVLVRYLKACGYRLLSEQQLPDGSVPVQRWSNKRKTIVEYHQEQAGGTYILQTVMDPKKFQTRAPHSIMTRVEDLEEKAGEA